MKERTEKERLIQIERDRIMKSMTESENKTETETGTVADLDFSHL